MRIEPYRADVTDRRRSLDRRRNALPTIKSLFVYRDRRQLRRAADRQGFALLDYYAPSMITPVILVLSLSIVDAVLTLYLMAHGAVELNPVMAFFLRLGSVPFMLAKYIFTAVSVTIIVLFNYFVIRPLKIITRDLLLVFALGFSLVIVWELVLIFNYVL